MNLNDLKLSGRVPMERLGTSKLNYVFLKIHASLFSSLSTYFGSIFVCGPASMFLDCSEKLKQATPKQCQEINLLKIYCSAHWLFNKFKSVFHPSVLLLIVNFWIHWSKQLSTVAIVGFQFGLCHVVAPFSFSRSISLALFVIQNRRLLWKCYEEILGLHVTSSFCKILNQRATKVIIFIRHERG